MARTEVVPSRAPTLQIASDAEAVVGILQLRGNAGAGSAARHLHMMAPRTAARAAARAGFGPRGISFGRARIVVGRVPVAAPLVHVFADIKQAKRIGWVLRHRLWASPPTGFVIWQLPRRRITPGIRLVFNLAACRALPFGFRGQAIAPAFHAAQPLAILRGFEP